MPLCLQCLWFLRTKASLWVSEQRHFWRVWTACSMFLWFVWRTPFKKRRFILCCCSPPLGGGGVRKRAFSRTLFGATALTGHWGYCESVCPQAGQTWRHATKKTNQKAMISGDLPSKHFAGTITWCNWLPVEVFLGRGRNVKLLVVSTVFGLHQSLQFFTCSLGYFSILCLQRCPEQVALPSHWESAKVSPKRGVRSRSPANCN